MRERCHRCGPFTAFVFVMFFTHALDRRIYGVKIEMMDLRPERFNFEIGSQP
jgi:hypothetical protein